MTFKAISLDHVRDGNFKVSAITSPYSALVADMIVTPQGVVVDSTFMEGSKPYKDLYRTTIRTLKEHGWMPYY